MADELIDIINENNEAIGQEMKSKAHEEGLAHRVSAVLLQRNDGKFLIPTASDEKVEAGGFCHSAGGHVTAGDTYEVAAKRELSEECGIKVNNDVPVKLLSAHWFINEYPTRIEKEYQKVFLIKYDEEMGPIKLNEEQVNEQWISEDELKSIYQNEPDKLSGPLKTTCEKLFG